MEAAGPAAVVAADSQAAVAASAAAAQEGVGDMKEQAFIEQLQNEQIVTAISVAEAKTSGEIRIFISRNKSDSSAW